VDIFTINRKFLASIVTIVEQKNTSTFPFPTRVQTKIVRLGLACFLPVLVLLAKFNLVMEAAHALLANFAGPKLHEWKCT